jgi:hypothetical protein
MQPSFASQMGDALVQAPSSALFAQIPPLHVSLVQAIPSSQSVSAQQALQPLPLPQHFPPLTQDGNEHLPAVQRGVWQALWAMQSLSLAHSAVLTQAFAVTSHVDPAGQASVCAHVP